MKKPSNVNLSPKLRAFVDEFIRLNDRKSVTAVVEEALREFFKKRGADPDVPIGEILAGVKSRLEHQEPGPDRKGK